MKTTVIYHRADFDGIFCREIARKFLPDAELIGWDFGDTPIPVPKAGAVYVMDLPVDRVFGFTFGNKTEDMISVLDIFGDVNGIKEFNSRLIWIDHHKSSIETHPNDIPGYRIDGVAACRLAWQWFTHAPTWHLPEVSERMPLPTKEHFIDREVSEPMAVRLAGEYDIWDKRDLNAELFQHGLRSRDLTDSDWRILLGNPRHPSIDEIERMMDVGHPFQLRPDGTCDESLGTVEGLLNGGRVVQYAKTKENESIIKAAGFTLEFEGLRFLAVNHARYNSHLFTAGLKPEHDGCFGFAWRDGQWAVSLYHAPGKDHHDLSEIAKKYGGGGHRGACGFRADKLPFLNP